jgi:hypothetical protein
MEANAPCDSPRYSEGLSNSFCMVWTVPAPLSAQAGLGFSSAVSCVASLWAVPALLYILAGLRFSSAVSYTGPVLLYVQAVLGFSSAFS